jgi:hypothetical protein
MDMKTVVETARSKRASFQGGETPTLPTDSAYR